jgi:hypothetical protein
MVSSLLIADLATPAVSVTSRAARCRVDYVLTVSQLGEDSVTVELEQEFNSMRWRGDFTAECTYCAVRCCLDNFQLTGAARSARALMPQTLRTSRGRPVTSSDSMFS